MFFCTLFSVAASLNVGIHFKRKPEVFKSESGFLGAEPYKKSNQAFTIKNFEVKHCDSLSPDVVYGLDRMLDDKFKPSALPFSKTVFSENAQGRIETPVTGPTLLSLFFSKFFTPSTRDGIVVSAPDDFDEEKREKLGSAFFTLGFLPKVIPESTCLAVHISSLLSTLSTEVPTLMDILNLRGNEACISHFKLKLKEDKKTIEIECSSERKKIEELISDKKMEEIVRRHVVGVLTEITEEVRNGVPLYFLPYDESITDKTYYWCDPYELILRITDSLATEFPEYLFKLGIDCTLVKDELDKSNLNTKLTATNLTIPLDPIRNEVKEQVRRELFISLVREQTTLHIITDYLYLKQLIEDEIKKESVTFKVENEIEYTGAVSKGAFWVNDKSKRVIIDSDIKEGPFKKDEGYLKLSNELKTKSRALLLSKNLEKELEKLKYLAQDSFEDITKFQLDKDSLENCSGFIGAYDSLYAKNKSIMKEEEKKKAAEIERRMSISGLALQFEKIKGIENPRMLELIDNALVEEMRTWYEENKENSEVATEEFNRNKMKLLMMFSKAKRIVDQEEEEKRKAEEKSKEEEEAPVEEGEVPTEPMEEAEAAEPMEEERKDEAFDEASLQELYARLKELASKSKDKGAEGKSEEQQPEKEGL